MIKSVIFLIIVIIIYYLLNNYFPERFTNRGHIYFIVICSIYTLIIYLMNYEKGFVYKILKNVKDIDERPLYNMEHIMYMNNGVDKLKNNIAIRQGWHCISCMNPILQKDIINCRMEYIVPLKSGGRSEVNNIGLYCDDCSNFIKR